MPSGNEWKTMPQAWQTTEATTFWNVVIPAPFWINQMKRNISIWKTDSRGNVTYTEIRSIRAGSDWFNIFILYEVALSVSKQLLFERRKAKYPWNRQMGAANIENNPGNLSMLKKGSWLYENNQHTKKHHQQKQKTKTKYERTNPTPNQSN